MNIQEITRHITRNRKKISESLTHIADLLEILDPPPKRSRKKILAKKTK